MVGTELCVSVENLTFVAGTVIEVLVGKYCNHCYHRILSAPNNRTYFVDVDVSTFFLGLCYII